MSSQRLHFRNQQTGYILPLTLAALLMLILIASYVGSISQAAITKVIATRERAEVEYELESAKAQIIHILALAPRTIYGLGTEDTKSIIPDGRTYAVNEHIRVQLQDLRGLLPLNAGLNLPAPAQRLANLLQTYSVPGEAVNQLVDALYDYRDQDTLHRINGAESSQYLAEGKIPPRNLNLQDVVEIYRVMGWLEAEKYWRQDEISQYLSIQSNVAFNPNVAPPRVLAAISGLPLQEAQDIVAQKRKSPSGDISRLLFPNLGDPFSGSGFVLRNTGPSIRVSLWDKRQSWTWQFEMQTTPDQVIAPWIVSNARQIPVSTLSIEKEAPQLLPTLNELRPLNSVTNDRPSLPNRES
jgi:Type II secretion system (T2SS), protein K